MNTPATPMSALPEDVGKQRRIGENWTAEQWREVAARNLECAYAERALKIEAESRAATLSREIERLRAERDADLNALRAAVERRVLEEAAKGLETRAAECGDSIVGRGVAAILAEEASKLRSLTTGSGAGEDTKGNE